MGADQKRQNAEDREAEIADDGESDDGSEHGKGRREQGKGVFRSQDLQDLAEHADSSEKRRTRRRPASIRRHAPQRKRRVSGAPVAVRRLPAGGGSAMTVAGVYDDGELRFQGLDLARQLDGAEQLGSLADNAAQPCSAEPAFAGVTRDKVFRR